MAYFKREHDDGSQDPKVSFALQVIEGRWFMIIASLQIMAMAGMNYQFSLYSNTIKSSMGYDQTSLNLFSFSKDIGAYIGLVLNLISQVQPPLGDPIY